MLHVQQPFSLTLTHSPAFLSTQGDPIERLFHRPASTACAGRAAALIERRTGGWSKAGAKSRKIIPILPLLFGNSTAPDVKTRWHERERA
jgi:hypothetical protein